MIQRLIRFIAKDGRTYYGDAILPSGETNIGKTTQAKIIQGSPWARHAVSDQITVCIMIYAYFIKNIFKPHTGRKVLAVSPRQRTCIHCAVFGSELCSTRERGKGNILAFTSDICEFTSN